MNPTELIKAKRTHLARLTNQRGAAGELGLLNDRNHWVSRPSGIGLRVLLEALRETGINIKRSSFDAIALPNPQLIDFTDANVVRAALSEMVFIEIKTANQKRVGPDFSGFFFALTESEIVAADALGERHRVALYNNMTGDMLMTSVADIIARAKSTNWQVSV